MKEGEILRKIIVLQKPKKLKDIMRESGIKKGTFNNLFKKDTIGDKYKIMLLGAGINFNTEAQKVQKVQNELSLPSKTLQENNKNNDKPLANSDLLLQAFSNYEERINSLEEQIAGLKNENMKLKKQIRKKNEKP